MLSILIQICFIAVFVNGNGMGPMLGPGLWHVLNVQDCPEEYPIKMEVVRRKVNRTHDGFNVKMNLDHDVDDSYGVYMDMCKYVDGGCKPYSTLTKECLPDFVHQYAAENVRQFFQAGDIDPPDFPLAKGQYEVRNFVFNYAELPEEAPYGEFGVDAYVTRGAERLYCLHLRVQFTETDDDDGDRE